jgi:hypothetical protein
MGSKALLLILAESNAPQRPFGEDVAFRRKPDASVTFTAGRRRRMVRALGKREPLRPS